MANVNLPQLAIDQNLTIRNSLSESDELYEFISIQMRLLRTNRMRSHKKSFPASSQRSRPDSFAVSHSTRSLRFLFN